MLKISVKPLSAKFKPTPMGRPKNGNAYDRLFALEEAFIPARGTGISPEKMRKRISAARTKRGITDIKLRCGTDPQFGPGVAMTRKKKPMAAFTITDDGVLEDEIF